MFKRIFCIADIHGSYIPIENFWNRHKEKINFSPQTDCIILLGDAGLNYYLNKNDKKFKYELGKYPFTYFCIRGNHEERPSIIASQKVKEWQTETFFENIIYVEKDYPYIKYALDNIQIYNISYLNTDNIIKKYKTLIIPGAYSIDKYYRIKNGWNWFKFEQLSKEEQEEGRKLIQKNPEFDIVLSHTCPISYEPTDLFLPFIDQSTVDRSMEQFLEEIEYNIEYKLYLFGHFHNLRIYPKKDKKQIIMLFNKEVFNLTEYFNTFNPYFSLY